MGLTYKPDVGAREGKTESSSAVFELPPVTKAEHD
jgi:hypothetical protein